VKFTVDVDVLIPMSDGTKLATNIWRPQGSAPVPALLTRNPYSKDAMTHYGNNTAPNIFTLVEAGYAVAVQDLRGAFRSEGEFVTHVNEPSDGADTVRWLAQQDWCDGNVGMYGASFLGMVQWQAATEGVANLKAIVPSLTSADLYAAPWYSPGGALSLGIGLFWHANASLRKLQRAAARGEDVGEEMAAVAALLNDFDRWTRDTPVNHQPVLGEQIPWVTEMLAHRTRDEFWGSLGALDRCEDITAPALNIGGWYDMFIGETLKSYVTMRKSGGSDAAREGQQLIVGPWCHGEFTGAFPEIFFGFNASAAAADLTSAHLAFFDKWVRNRTMPDTGSATDRVRIFVMGANEWRSEADWPLPDTKYIEYYLSDDVGSQSTAEGPRLLSRAIPLADSTDVYIYDPRDPVPSVGGDYVAPGSHGGPADQRDVELRDDVIVFRTEVLQTAVEVTGPIRLTLYVSSTARDTDFTGKLVDVHPDGRALVLCTGIQRMRFRDSLTAPSVIEPGSIYKVDMELSPTSNTFLPGHRILLEVSSSNFPRYERNSNTGESIGDDPEQSMISAENAIHRGPSHPSALVLPIIER
jgi:putative CocE/NonD family hydrolase